jgi:acetyltransferase-like isoleucine patch superfamily enzyme
MRMIGSAVRALLAARSRTEGFLRTVAARSSAELGHGSRLLEGANVYNIRKVRESIWIGKNSLIGGDLLTFAHGGEIRIGDWCYVGKGSHIWSGASVRIGDRVLISHGVNIHDCDSHPKDAGDRHRQFVQIATRGHPIDIRTIASEPIRIDDDVWIGFNASIMKGVVIGARSIIAAGSIVTRSVPPDSMVVGSNLRQINP